MQVTTAERLMLQNLKAAPYLVANGLPCVEPRHIAMAVLLQRISREDREPAKVDKLVLF
jgi:hypothetical protein